MNQTNKIIQLDKNENALGCSYLVHNSIKQSLKIHQYPNSRPLNLIDKISQRNGVSPDQVMFGNGSDELLFMIARYYSSPTSEIIIPHSSFEGFDFAAKLAGAKVVKSPLNNFKINLSQISQRITDKTSIIFLANPNNPTGSFIAIEEIEAWLAELPKNIIVVIDEAYIEYAILDSSNHICRITDLLNNVIFTRTFSKIYGLAALRIGYCIAGETVIKNIEQYRAPYNTNTVSQIAASTAIDDFEHIKTSFLHAEQEKKFIYECVEQLRGEYVESKTNFVLIRFLTNMETLYKFLSAKGIFTKFFVDEHGVGFLRVTIGKHDELVMLFSLVKEFLIDVKGVNR
ncbi:hypothetical protein CJF42_03420 [Pseudoalteromonas sp. NBT06-2]|uniref:pyridoxal phosphate-dependent aminotransferase n=1 Tax=Pseudoalteromonas sp. NBT06-2 TaxID=2025950 RepID=UPI000BA55461|nr:histidinol-phosphate transaminase [Pseudoalteromonas sp. NBT06-2]PAJ75778.1 hypothetical protein CJF42_03420 [Pseudoalteromonas sp. NBT06-2]